MPNWPQCCHLVSNWPCDVICDRPWHHMCSVSNSRPVHIFKAIFSSVRPENVDRSTDQSSIGHARDLWCVTTLVAMLLQCHMWHHMRSRTILPSRCRHCTMAVPIDQRLIYKCIFIRSKQEVKVNWQKAPHGGAHSPVRGHPRGSKFVPLNSWGRGSY